MVWFWMRGGESLQLETRYDNETSEFVVTVNSPDGHNRTERYKDIEAFPRAPDLARTATRSEGLEEFRAAHFRS